MKVLLVLLVLPAVSVALQTFTNTPDVLPAGDVELPTSTNPSDMLPAVSVELTTPDAERSSLLNQPLKIHSDTFIEDQYINSQRHPRLQYGPFHRATSLGKAPRRNRKRGSIRRRKPSSLKTKRRRLFNDGNEVYYFLLEHKKSWHPLVSRLSTVSSDYLFYKFMDETFPNGTATPTTIPAEFLHLVLPPLLPPPTRTPKSGGIEFKGMMMKRLYKKLSKNRIWRRLRKRLGFGASFHDFLRFIDDTDYPD